MSVGWSIIFRISKCLGNRYSVTQIRLLEIKKFLYSKEEYLHMKIEPGKYEIRFGNYARTDTSSLWINSKIKHKNKKVQLK